MNILREYIDIVEGRDAPLYHGLKLKYAARSLKEDNLLGTTTQRYWPDGKRLKDNEPGYRDSFWMKGVSLTRDKFYAERWGEVVFALDQRLLSQSYKIVPFNWGYSIPQGNHHKREKEEFLVTSMTGKTQYDFSMDTYDFENPNKPTDKPLFSGPDEVSNLNKYLLGIYMYKGAIDTWNNYGDDTARQNIELIKNHPKFIGIYNR